MFTGPRRPSDRLDAGIGRLTRVLVGVLAGLTLASGGSACGHRARAGTAGDKHNVCIVVALFDRLPEPNPEDVHEVVRYAEDYVSILRQTSYTQKWKDKKNKYRVAPAAVRADL